MEKIITAAARQPPSSSSDRRRQKQHVKESEGEAGRGGSIKYNNRDI